MQESMGGRDAAYIRRWVSEQYQLRRAAGSPVVVREIIDAVVDHLRPLEHPHLDLESLVRVVAQQACDACSRARTAGVRRSERTRDADGAAVDAPREQLLIPQLREVGERKVAHGKASLDDGRWDIAVADAAEHLAVAMGVNPAATKVGQVLSGEQIARIRARFDDIAKAA